MTRAGESAAIVGGGEGGEKGDGDSGPFFRIGIVRGLVPEANPQHVGVDDAKKTGPGSGSYNALSSRALFNYRISLKSST